MIPHVAPLIHGLTTLAILGAVIWTSTILLMIWREHD